MSTIIQVNCITGEVIHREATQEELAQMVNAPTVEQLAAEAAAARTAAMLAGAPYNGYQVSFTAEDGNGMLQVKATFELGLASTTIHFANGTKMPIAAADFPAFAAWFVQQRNGFFV